MKPKTFRNAIAAQCGFNKAKQDESSLDRVLRQEGLDKWPTVESQQEYWKRLDEEQDARCCENCDEIDQRILDNRDNITNPHT